MSFLKVLQRELNPDSERGRSRVFFWLGLSLAFALVYSTLGLRQAFSSDYVVQDDVRQHVFWMWRFVDSELLSNDLISNYFESVAPPGYWALYRLMAALGVHPLTFSKILPAFLCLSGTVYCYYFCLEVVSVPIVGFANTVLLNQSLWMDVDVPSGTPRAFTYILLLAFFYYVLKRATIFCGILIVLQALFYPPLVLISMALLAIRSLEIGNGRLRLSRDRRDLQIGAMGIALSILLLSPYALWSSEFGPTITLAEAQAMPEFQPGGRSVFFDDNFWFYWLGGDSGFFHRGLTEPLTLLASLLLPIQFGVKRWFVFVDRICNREIFLQLILASAGLFFLAHALLFKLYAPNRYTIHTLRIVMALAAAIAFASLLDAILRWIVGWPIGARGRSLAAGTTAVFFAAGVAFYPCFMESFIEAGYLNFDREAPLHEFLRKQPKESVVATLTNEADNISTFAARSVLVSREHARPYDVGFYQEFQKRVADLISAQYSPDFKLLQETIHKYDIDIWLIDKQSLNLDWLSSNSWLRQFQPEYDKAITNLNHGELPAIASAVESCTVFVDDEIVVLQADCILAIEE